MDVDVDPPGSVGVNLANKNGDVEENIQGMVSGENEEVIYEPDNEDGRNSELEVTNETRSEHSTPQVDNTPNDGDNEGTTAAEIPSNEDLETVPGQNNNDESPLMNPEGENNVSNNGNVGEEESNEDLNSSRETVVGVSGEGDIEQDSDPMPLEEEEGKVSKPICVNVLSP